MESAAMDPESNGLCALAGPRRAIQDQSEREAWALDILMSPNPPKEGIRRKQTAQLDCFSKILINRNSIMKLSR